ncbi:hypothetical protein NUU61_001101 [Penicillium alfredii]|uniref:Cyanovirin-N domain-containing protein n=1 Tax=Penicillium alfredii TaxID=1506179 RepID=A0A9W9GBX6_9EURO|nr:uncharacterized protein NUU61_001101 [Penicillium alfredii]KAJ5115342.1 hypothetical protein NUU61_001101 [Penicillium alfredii]
MLSLKLLLALGFSSLAVAKGFTSSCKITSSTDELPTIKAMCYQDGGRIAYNPNAELNLDDCFELDGNELKATDQKGSGGVSACSGVELVATMGKLKGGCLGKDKEFGLYNWINNLGGNLVCHT